jgi:hypothetical protein
MTTTAPAPVWAQPIEIKYPESDGQAAEAELERVRAELAKLRGK